MRSFGMTGLLTVAALAFGFSAMNAHGEAFALSTCPISGKPLGDKPVTKEINGRQVSFCCGGCPAKYEADPAKYDAKIDADMIADQESHYPLTTCLVAGEGHEMDADRVKIVYNNRLVEFCCADCEEKFKADPDTYLSKLDEAVKAKQEASYPLKECIVSGEELGSMGEPKEMIVANRLVKFCCGGCIKKFEANPSAYLSKLDKGEEKPAQ